MRHNQTKWIKVFNHEFINISITNPMSSLAFNTVKIDYFTFFLSYLIRQTISGVNTSEILYFQVIYPFLQVKVGKRFINKMLPSIGIPLKGLFFPNNNPWPFFFPFQFFYLFLFFYPFQ